MLDTLRRENTLHAAHDSCSAPAAVAANTLPAAAARWNADPAHTGGLSCSWDSPQSSLLAQASDKEAGEPTSQLEQEAEATRAAVPQGVAAAQHRDTLPARRLPPGPVAFLRPGQTFEGRQRVEHCRRTRITRSTQEEDDHWSVRATVLAYDAAAGTLAGTMQAAVALPDVATPQDGVVTTFFEADIVDNSNHTFYGGKEENGMKFLRTCPPS